MSHLEELPPAAVERDFTGKDVQRLRGVSEHYARADKTHDAVAQHTRRCVLWQDGGRNMVVPERRALLHADYLSVIRHHAEVDAEFFLKLATTGPSEHCVRFGTDVVGGHTKNHLADITPR